MEGHWLDGGKRAHEWRKVTKWLPVPDSLGVLLQPLINLGDG